MIQHARFCLIRTLIFDPGQPFLVLMGDDLKNFIAQSHLDGQ
jgi:hypothetical protein